MEVVLVHGLAGSPRWWGRVVPAVEAHHRVHVLAVPRGRRGGDETAWLEERLEELDRPVLVGHSLGGLVCARIASRRPDAVAGLVLVAPAGLPLGRGAVRMTGPLLSAVRRGGPRLLPALADGVLRAGPLGLASGARQALAADVGARLGRITAPVLLLWGERDPLVRPDLATRWLEALPDGRLVLLRGAGHVPMIEAPDDFARALLDFAEELER
jgi:pimeloyl-ACP methyl ester carboxylesterase